MKQMSWAYARIVDFWGALLSLPVSLLFPPFDNDIVPDDLIETINPYDWNWLFTNHLDKNIVPRLLSTLFEGVMHSANPRHQSFF